MVPASGSFQTLQIRVHTIYQRSLCSFHKLDRKTSLEICFGPGVIIVFILVITADCFLNDLKEYCFKCRESMNFSIGSGICD
jgi:hypothetical protein